MLREIEYREKFLFTLDWLLSVLARYPLLLQFGLIQIDFANPQALGNAYGAQEASHKLDDVLLCLRGSIRKADLIMRDGPDLWILVPYTPAEESLGVKVSHAIRVASQCGLQIVERNVSIFSLPFAAHEIDEACTAEQLLAYLKKNHIALANREILLPAQ